MSFNNAEAYAEEREMVRLVRCMCKRYESQKKKSRESETGRQYKIAKSCVQAGSREAKCVRSRHKWRNSSV